MSVEMDVEPAGRSARREAVRSAVRALFDETLNRRVIAALETGVSSLILIGSVLIGPLVLVNAVTSNLLVGAWTLVRFTAACLTLDFAIKAARIVATRRTGDVRRAFLSILVASTLVCLEQMKEGLAGSLRRLHEDAGHLVDDNYHWRLQRFRDQSEATISARQRDSWERLQQRRVEDSIASLPHRPSPTSSGNAQKVDEKGVLHQPSAAQSPLDLTAPAPEEIVIPHWLAALDWAGPFGLSFAALIVLLRVQPASNRREQPDP